MIFISIYFFFLKVHLSELSVNSLWFSCYWNLHFCGIPPCYWRYKAVLCLSVGDCKEQTRGNLLDIISELNFQDFTISEQNLLPRTIKCLTLLSEWTSWPASFLQFLTHLRSSSRFLSIVSLLWFFFSGFAFLTTSAGSPWQNNAVCHFFLLTQLWICFFPSCHRHITHKLTPFINSIAPNISPSSK